MSILSENPIDTPEANTGSSQSAIHTRQVKSLLYKMVIIAALLLVLLAGNILRRTNRTPDPGGVYEYLESSIDAGAIQIQGGSGHGVRLLRASDGAWLVEDSLTGELSRGREERISAFLNDLLSMEFSRTVTETGNFSEYGLEINTVLSTDQEMTPVILTIFDSRERVIETFIFGSYSPDTSELFFRFARDSTVHAVSPDIGFYLNQAPQYWVELRLWQPLRDGTTRTADQFYRSYADGTTAVWTREGRLNWSSNEGEPVEDPSAVGSAAAMLVRLEAESVFSARGDVPQSAYPVLTVGVNTLGSEILEARIYRLDEPGTGESPRYLVEPVRGPWFTSAQGTVRILEISEEEFERFLAI